ncbi:hypothetical protein QBC35DRAFT_502587 [Podospora australis]|uniref:Lipocalin-like domain-containing protein n=1 Tax=Podospora australis TaxID=1536484 RepID=A0AAN6WPG2_9PEZI|nr:hypothetical protein QBC35DRAFT_502587 [Podospora australis]
MKPNPFAAIAGIYQLHNYTNYDQNNQPFNQPNWGTSTPEGIINYSPTGFVSTVMRSSDPALLPSSDLTYPPKANQSDHDWTLIGRSTLAYAGPYTVHEVGKGYGWIEHGPLVFTHVPSMTGNSLFRNYSTSRETLGEGGKEKKVVVIKLTFPLGGNGRSELFWKKID